MKIKDKVILVSSFAFGLLFFIPSITNYYSKINSKQWYTTDAIINNTTVIERIGLSNKNGKRKTTIYEYSISYFTNNMIVNGTILTKYRYTDKIQVKYNPLNPNEYLVVALLAKSNNKYNLIGSGILLLITGVFVQEQKKAKKKRVQNEKTL